MFKCELCWLSGTLLTASSSNYRSQLQYSLVGKGAKEYDKSEALKFKN